MSKQATALLEAFEALPAEERQEFAVEVLRRTREMPFHAAGDWPRSVINAFHRIGRFPSIDGMSTAQGN